NRRIARLARVLARETHMDVPAPITHVPHWYQVLETPRVAVLVENVEHAVCLAQHLPQWGLCFGREVTLAGLSRQQRKMLLTRAVGEEPLLGNIILTMSAASGEVVGNIDALIRADGGLRMPSWMQNDLITPQDAPRSLLVVDFDDRHHPQLRRWSKSRFC